SARAQDLEPRAYVNTPVGLNFLIAGYAYSQGGLSTDPALPIQDAQLQIHGAVLAYARSLDVGGRSGKFDVIVPYAHLSGTRWSRASRGTAASPVSATRDSAFRYS